MDAHSCQLAFHQDVIVGQEMRMVSETRVKVQYVDDETDSLPTGGSCPCKELVEGPNVLTLDDGGKYLVLHRHIY